ncbi:16S rRNA (cytosine967-C5)-methyltransferase [Desulfacinum hydrothermale DSM 13146]|uniref:16S rRNA (cytosine(967)-C(5))-methyltransferase n=1 Tax=Desulfacinum hydrothermale DSM 13146 TaxID=1121390 RepID=A0A1W1XEP2_9BACT|nr:16S rRNA (cytosine(967)-C(5))-methyltransferase RsmB [Desulfacinum hydrothermale]SMC22370.1 16S rRNA (cytosine967-C5)-methyltransferase [Desulfacinum hydrothermale DSM 13146]
MDNVRATAHRILLQMEWRPAHPDRLLRTALERHRDMSDRDRALLTELVYGVLRWRRRLDWHLEVLVGRKKVDPPVRTLLRLGLYQILFLTKVPAHAAVNETVELAKTAHPKHIVGFVNGVLRQAVRRGNDWPFPDPASQPVLSLAVETSHPDWFAEYALKRWGYEEARRILEANNRLAGITVRVNTRRIAPDQVRTWFEQQGVAVEPSPVLSAALRLSSLRMDMSRLEPFQNGWIQVQDEASQLVSLALAPEPGERVLDLCAGFGGKTTHLAALMEDRGEITAVDEAAWKLEALQDNARRQGWTCIRTHVADALTLDPDRLGLFDRVLVDAPCTGFGVLRRHPDIKWRRSIKAPFRASRTQSALLRQAARFVRRGGILVYATCTIFQEENRGVVEGFLRDESQWGTEPVIGVLPQSCRDMADGSYLQSWPHRHGTDGFFIARLRRVEGNE